MVQSIEGFIEPGFAAGVAGIGVLAGGETGVPADEAEVAPGVVATWVDSGVPTWVLELDPGVDCGVFAANAGVPVRFPAMTGVPLLALWVAFDALPTTEAIAVLAPEGKAVPTCPDGLPVPNTPETALQALSAILNKISIETMLKVLRDIVLI